MATPNHEQQKERALVILQHRIPDLLLLFPLWIEVSLFSITGYGFLYTNVQHFLEESFLFFLKAVKSLPKMHDSLDYWDSQDYDPAVCLHQNVMELKILHSLYAV